MQLSRETEYAIRCIYLLARDPARVVGVEEIARTMQIPRSFLAKILQKLTRAGFLRSTRGAHGGFSLAREPSDIRLYDIFVLTEGPAVADDSCAVSKQVCRLDGFCVLHPFWVKIRRDLTRLLKANTAAELGVVSRYLNRIQPGLKRTEESLGEPRGRAASD